MKFHWFHLMPYPDLPQDFSKKYPSVWVTPPAHLYEGKVMHRAYHEYLDELEFAEKMGFDGICVNEHHQNAYGTMPSPNIMAATLTRRTSRAAIVVLGNSIALYNPPVRVAEEFAMLDVLSGGRLVAGFPVGTSMDTNYCYGMTPATLRERYYEAHDLIMKAWTEQDIFAFNGKYTQLRYVNIWPRPLQKPHPPVWIPGGGSIETWVWSAQNDYVYCYLSYGGYRRAQAAVNGYWNAVDSIGKDRNPYRTGFLQLVAVSETDEQAEKDYAAHAHYFYDKCLHIGGGFQAPGYRTQATLERGFLDQFRDRLVAQVTPQQRQSNVTAPDLALEMENTWKERLETGSIIAGSPATVRERLEECIESLNVGHLMVLMQWGDMPKEKVQKSTELFAKEVMPYLRGKFSNWEDKWYPSGIPQEERAKPAPVGS
jgi:alkanesulfonate monooxygenase SsuD/methylene tetrahydromethanopterin reductase-like flavin-dependent oxidoreductase (luciferase family)